MHIMRKHPMRSIYSLFFILLAIFTSAHAGVVYSTLTCPKTITVPGDSFVPASISLPQISQIKNGVINPVSASYLHGIAFGRRTYVNPSHEPIKLQLVRSICYGQTPLCDYERPSNASYWGPNGPGYLADASACVSCSKSSDNSFACGRNS